MKVFKQRCNGICLQLTTSPTRKMSFCKYLARNWKIIKSQQNSFWLQIFTKTKNLPVPRSELNRDTTFCSAPNSISILSSLSLSTNDFTEEKFKPVLSLTGEESRDDIRRSFIDLTVLVVLQLKSI